VNDSGGIDTGDITINYDGIHFLDEVTIIDLTTGNKNITINLDDTYALGFYESFDGGVPAGWDIPPSLWTVSGGTLRMEGQGSGVPTGSVWGDDSVDDFVFSVALDQVQGDYANGDWGILFRFDIDNEEGYVLWVSKDGSTEWGIDRLDSGGSGDEIAGGTGFSAGDRVRVECVGDTVAVYINGSLEFSTDSFDTTYSSGYVGVYGWDDSSEDDENIYTYDDAWLVYIQ
jgi:hypothetical protein